MLLNVMFNTRWVSYLFRNLNILQGIKGKTAKMNQEKYRDAGIRWPHGNEFVS